ncbi:hypothetical protein L207DRAFT_628147 [Hyaloscypha variabilis F]|uniref:BHLH domain-containing protein n=1 Tax=Hyaloscypha variabilis (strain UAMH 11265 / GT02V1 / F) TaxID=1149755 RepID=A0A2J6S9S6_HYAVF|nr:hypothetical protein L207DRAFT_628147 [Hyaloscypha variabilis F]
MTFNQGTRGDVYLTDRDGQDDSLYGLNYHTSSEYCYPLGYSPQSPAKSPGWAFSPIAVPTSPYMESPLPGVGFYADSTWDPFEQSFSSVQNSVENGNFLPYGYQATYSSNTQTGTQPYVSLAAINESTTFDDVLDDRISSGPYEISPLSSPITNCQSEESRWASRSNSTSSGSSKPVTPTKRRKSSGKGSHSSHSHSRSKSESIPRLRSTTQSSRPTTSSSSSSSSKSPPVSDDSKGRTNHNQVEKQYRNRLNGQFEMLLSALPSEDGSDGARSRVSKAEVLMLAKRHIVELEREKMMLEGQHHALEGDVEDLKKKFMEMGGVCMP